MPRALPRSSAVSRPSTIRRVCPAMAYCTIHECTPLARTRRPKPGMSSSKLTLSITPGGNLILRMVAALRRIIRSPALDAPPTSRFTRHTCHTPLHRGALILERELERDHETDLNRELTGRSSEGLAEEVLGLQA